MVLSNVVFNYILIFGKFGVPQLGIAGAAIGSSLAELVSLIFFILYTRHRIDIRKYGLDKIPGIRWNILKRMLNVSFWTMVQNFLSLSTWFLLFLYVEHLGERSLAVTNIIRNVSGIMFMVMMHSLQLRIACQQPYRSRTHRLRARYYTAAYPHSLCVRVARLPCSLRCAPS